jgi:hypothetical protein
MTDFFFQLVLCLLGTTIGVFAATTTQNTQKIISGIVAFVLIMISFVWLGYEIGTRSARSSAVQTPEYCDDIRVSAIPNQAIISIPSQETTWIDIAYEIKAPSQTGIKVLLHSVQVFVQQGSQDTILVEGAHVTHFGKSIGIAQV